MGVLPGSVNFLMGDQIRRIRSEHRNQLEMPGCDERRTIIETVDLSFLRYRQLLGTPYAGAASISDATAVGPAIHGWHRLCLVRTEPGSIRGVMTLARFLTRAWIDAVFRDRAAWDIDLFASTRDATGRWCGGRKDPHG